MSLIQFFKDYFNEKRSKGSERVAPNNNSKASESELSGMTVVSLKALAKERGLSGYSKLNKAALVELLS